MSRTWFDKFWTHEDICPRLKYLLEDFDEVRQEFLDNKDKLVWNSWNYGLKRYQKDWVYKAYEGWSVAGLFAEKHSAIDWGNLGYTDEHGTKEDPKGVYKCTGTDDILLDRVDENGIGSVSYTHLRAHET